MQALSSYGTTCNIGLGCMQRVPGKPKTKETGRMMGVPMQSRDAECGEEMRMRIEVF